ncbi:ion transporter [Antrihabitans cavernicola]|uniref:Ion transporter n=1 Tax=Antrihabitans cavernicola TaxID=2495913 RepID=A0A5A7SJX2_9NOCA|nr:ion transporter [Spelaeibacter cavernicola]KAA0024491.1 ion transporter [Spelaeibacter cavernicola]
MTQQQARLSRPPVRSVDWLMLALAVLSVIYLVWITFWHVSASTLNTVHRVDYVVCAIFAIDFLVRWRRERTGWRFLLRNWYEILGMIPIATPIVRSFPALKILFVLARLGRVLDRAFGDQITSNILNRFTRGVVGLIKRPITIAVLDEVGGVLRSGHYTQNIARALEENHRELDDMILELIKNDPQTGRLKFLPFHDDVVRLAADTTFRIIMQMLADPRTDELVSDMLRENVEQIRSSVHELYRAEGPAAKMPDFDPPDRPTERFPR